MVGLQWRAFTGTAFAVLAILAVSVALPSFPLKIVAVLVALGLSVVPLVLSLRHFNDPQIVTSASQDRTARALHKVAGWQTIDSLRYESAEVDHVVITSRAVLAVSTTYHGALLADASAEAERTARDLVKAAAAGDVVRAFLRAHRLHTTAEVVSVLVEWGAGRPTLDEGYRLIRGIYLVDGERPEQWTECFAGRVLSEWVRNTISDAFEVFTFERDRWIAGHQPWIGRRLVDEVMDGVAQERADRLRARSSGTGMRRRHVLL
jgi:hypothetical protein